MKHLGILAAWAARIGTFVAAACIWTIVVIVSYDVAARYLGRPTLWAVEVSGYMMLAAALLGAGDAVSRDQHFRIDILVRALPGALTRALQILVQIMGIVFALGFTWGSLWLVNQSLRFGMKSGTLLSVPVAAIQMIVVAAGVLMVLGHVARLVAAAHERADHGTDPAR